MTAHLTMAAAAKLGLLAPFETGIHSFSNGSEWDCWADRNCYRCTHYLVDPNRPDDSCALEGAAMFRRLSPALARWFGWTESPDYPGSFHYPRECPLRKSPDDNDDRPAPPPPDPAQLVLLADPTEDAALIQNAPVVELPSVAAGPPGSGQ
jgi:hypothetical protein